MQSKAYYPVNLDLNSRKCLVIGGGKIAARKARTLLSFGAQVTVVSPALDKVLQRLARSGRIVHIKAAYQKKYLNGHFLVIAATDDAGVNRTVFSHAAPKNMLINVVDVPELCNFIVPSVVRRGPLVLGISTGGNSPMFAQQLRKKCEKCLTPRHGDFIRLMGQARQRIKCQCATMAERKALHRKIRDSQVLDLILKNKTAQAKKLLQDLLSGS